jgi:hypothetical protein
LSGDDLSCPGRFRISGTLQDGVGIAVFRSKNDATVTIEELVVSETTGSEDWPVQVGSEERVFTVPTSRNVWRLLGRADIEREIVYAKAPDGLEVMEGPLPLVPGRSYHVFVGGRVGVLWQRDAEGAFGSRWWS